MTGPPKEFLSLFARAFQGGTETSLSELIEMFKQSETHSTLVAAGEARDAIDKAGLELIPPFGVGRMSESRVLRVATHSVPLEEEVRGLIAAGEDSKQEFKSSLIFDHKRAANQPELDAKSLKSDGVLFSVLKTIAAFLTSGGGILIIGVDDKGAPLGIQFDYACFGIVGDGRDKWELALRNYLQTRFKDGPSINDYVTVNHCVIDEKSIAVIKVQARRALSFLKEGNDHRLFRRQGNRTLEVSIADIEEFLTWRSKEAG